MGSVFILLAAHHRGTLTVKQIIQCFLLVSFLGAIMSGCSSGIFNTEPFVDSHLDEKGNVVLEDTPKNWELYKFSVDSKVIKEAAGEAPEADMGSWNDYWLFRMQAIPENTENRDRYVKYISKSRHQEGLPELVNQAEQK